jgi:histidinol-phosphate phosphatase family protein
LKFWFGFLNLAGLNLCRAVFLDRDGTLIEERDYLSDPDGVVPLARSSEGLVSLQNAGFKLFVVSNQSGVGRGYFSMEDVERVNARMVSLFATHGVRFERIYVAPEAPGQASRGRKPSPQFLFDARDEFGVELGESYIVGDKWIDLECGWNAGLKGCILVRTGYGRKTEEERGEQLKRAVVVDDLAAAAEWILKQS